MTYLALLGAGEKLNLLIVDQEVGGSIPPSCTISPIKLYRLISSGQAVPAALLARGA